MEAAATSAAANRKPTKDKEDPHRISKKMRWGLTVFGLGVLAAAVVLWLSEPTPTIKTTIETTTEPGGPGAQGGAQTNTTRKVTKTISGRTTQEADAAPSGTASKRSEVVTAALLAICAIPLLLAAMGRWPTKVGAGGASAEWEARLTADECTDAAFTAINQSLDNHSDRDTMKEAVREALRVAWLDKEAFYAGTTPPSSKELTDWEMTSDSWEAARPSQYWDKIGRQAWERAASRRE